jgi:hypothetical protein
MMQSQLKALEDLDDQWATEGERFRDLVTDLHAKTAP